MEVCAGDEEAVRDDGAEGEDSGTVGNALSAAMSGIETEDVSGAREDDGGGHDEGPVGLELGIEVLNVKTDEEAAESGDVKEDGIESEMEGDVEPVGPEDAVGIHDGVRRR